VARVRELPMATQNGAKMFGKKRDKLAGRWTLSMALPEGWLQLPRRVELTDADVGSKEAMAASELWARSTADRLLGEDAGGLAQILVVHLRTAWEANPIFACVFIPHPERGVEANAQVAPMSPGLGTDLAEVRRVKDVPHRDLIRPREFADVELPLGPALLVYELFRKKDLGPDMILEGVTYWCTVTPAEAMVEFIVQWPDLELGDDLQEQAQFMAESIEFVAL
jgi:hypothetical protein